MLCYNISRMSETIGDKLKRAREARQLTLEQVAQTTRIRPRYLEALERGDLSAIPSNAQARGFLRIYAEFLGLDSNSLVPVRPAEPEPASSLDVEPPSAPETVSPPAPSRPGLLKSLRERFTRRAEPKQDAPVEESKPVAETQSPAPELEPFVPLRYTEELPAEPAPAVQESAPPQEPAPATSPRKTNARKNGTKRVKLLDSSEGENVDEVKKKLAAALPNRSRMKRV